MRKQSFILAFFGLPLFWEMQAQTCLSEGITFSSQAQIDSFQINYTGCTSISGGVTISGSDISNLGGMANISEISGNLIIQNNPSLTDITGLKRLKRVGLLTISANGLLPTLSGLDSLERVESCLLIQNNSSLTSLQGLESLSFVGSCSGGGPGLSWSRGVEINGNANLMSTEGLSSLDSLEYLIISGNSSLSSLSGLQNLTYVSGCMSIRNNSALTNLEGLESLSYVGGSACSLGFPSSIRGFSIHNNDALTLLSGLEELDSLGGRFSVTDNDLLNSLSGVDNLLSIGEILLISSNSSLNSLEALGKLTHIGQSLNLNNNLLLTSLTGLDHFDHLSLQELILQDNPNLAVCEVQSICDYIGNGGNATVYGNATGCSSTSEIESACLALSIDEFVFGERGSPFFPNPTQGMVYFQAKHPEGWELRIHTAMGQLISSSTLTNSGEIDISHLPHGIYLFVLRKGTQVFTSRIVKTS